MDITLKTSQKLLLGGVIYWGGRSLTAISMPLYLLSQGIPLSLIVTSKSLQLIVIACFSFITGFLSDKYGSKKAICISCLLEVIYFILIVSATETSVLVGEIINGLALAFYNGNYEKWLHDAEDRQFSRAYSFYQKYRFFFMGATVFAGGFFLLPTLIISAVINFALFFWFASCRESPVQAITVLEAKPNHRWHLSPVMILLAFFYIAVSSALTPIYSLWPTQLEVFSISAIYPGAIYFFAMLLQALICHIITTPVFRHAVYRPLLTISFVFIPAIFMVFLYYAIQNKQLSLIPILSWLSIFTVLALPTGAATLIFIEINTRLSQGRATFISTMDSLIKTLSGSIMFLLSIDKTSVLPNTWLWCGLILFIAGAALLFASIVPTKAST
ncbi:MAG: MFS transporter [Serratia liquefaciens]|nr:MFS transporter [Serratia liquefaciens]